MASVYVLKWYTVTPGHLSKRSLLQRRLFKCTYSMIQREKIPSFQTKIRGQRGFQKEK